MPRHMYIHQYYHYYYHQQHLLLLTPAALTTITSSILNTTNTYIRSIFKPTSTTSLPRPAPLAALPNATVHVIEKEETKTLIKKNQDYFYLGKSIIDKEWHNIHWISNSLPTGPMNTLHSICKDVEAMNAMFFSVKNWYYILIS